MKRYFDEEKHVITFKKLDSFDEMLLELTENICYSKNDCFGITTSDVGFITKKRTLFHKHIYYNLHDCAFCGNSVQRETFNTCGYTFYKKITRVKYAGKTFNSLQEYIHFRLDED